MILVLLMVWVVWNLFTRERRRRIDAGIQRAATVISLAFVAVGVAMLYRAMGGAGNGTVQALLLIAGGLAMIVYQGWQR